MGIFSCCSPSTVNETTHTQEEKRRLVTDSKQSSGRSGYSSASSMAPHPGAVQDHPYTAASTSASVGGPPAATSGGYKTPQGSPQQDRKQPLTPQSGGGYASKSASDVSKGVGDDF